MLADFAKTKNWFLIALRYVFVGNCDTVAVAQGSEVWRIDLDPGPVELILYILMQVGIDYLHILRYSRKGVQFI